MKRACVAAQARKGGATMRGWLLFILLVLLLVLLLTQPAW